jgi:hypothetical protein
MRITKGLTWPLLLLSIAALTVFLAGIASLQSTCQESGAFPGLTGITSSPTGVFGMSTSYSDCRRVMRFYWFSWAFVMVTLLGILVTAVTGLGLHFSRPFWIGMLAVSTILMMIASEAFLAFTDLYEGIRPPGVSDNTAPYTDNWIRRIRTAAAGAIITTAFLVLLMMGLGTDWEHRRGGYGRDDKLQTGHVSTAGAVPVSNQRVVEQV